MTIHSFKLIFCVVACSSLFAAEYLPVGGIAHVGFRAADLEKTRAFYRDVLGFQQAFDQKDDSGKVTLSVIKINEDQFLEFSAGVPEGTADRFTHVAFLSGKIEVLRSGIERLGLKPPELRTGRDRTRNFSLRDPDEHRIEFVQYELDSMQAQARGKFADDRRVTRHLDHVGVAFADRARAIDFFRGKLQFVEARTNMLQPTRQLSDAIELLPKGATSRLCFEVQDLKLAMKMLQERGVAAGSALHDPDGTPIEFIEEMNTKPLPAR